MKINNIDLIKFSQANFNTYDLNGFDINVSNALELIKNELKSDSV